MHSFGDTISITDEFGFDFLGSPRSKLIPPMETLVHFFITIGDTDYLPEVHSLRYPDHDLEFDQSKAQI